MPMPTMSPGCTVSMSKDSRVSSVIRGCPHHSGVAAARTKSHRGVITPTPKERWLGLTRWTVVARAVIKYLSSPDRQACAHQIDGVMRVKYEDSFQFATSIST